jgi:uncharacterized cupin superfamily protein
MTSPAAHDRLLGTDLLTADLGHEALPAADVVAGAPTAATRPLAEVGEVEVGLWEMSEGSARDTEVDEVFVVLSGVGEVRFEDGSTLALGPGTAVRLWAGERTEWTVTEPLRKVYVAR